ncbi:MAG: phytanoyl-CoA dioxygenase family protein, partial [Woeseiaceae bacterium]
MPKLLSQAAVEACRRDGFYSPIRVMSAQEARRYRDALEKHEAKTGQPLQGNWRHKMHLLFTWADELVHHPRILDAVEDVIGPDILCWTTNFFIKEARDPGFVSWHQDSTYWGLEPPEVITAWLALTDAPIESGAMKFIP